MADDERFGIKVVVPLDYHTPFDKVIENVSKLGLKVEKSYPKVQSIHGMGTQEVLNQLSKLPGIAASRAQTVTWDV